LPELKAAQAEQTAEIFNTLFSALRAAFPASLHSFNDQAEFNELRRQWALAFHENGVTTMEQVNAGLRVARRQERPFLPSLVNLSPGVAKVAVRWVSPCLTS
jgi:hypothetical protein